MKPKPRTRIGACQRNKDLVLQLCAEGFSLTVIARKIGTNRRHVLAFLRRNGVTKQFPKFVAADKHYNWKGGRIVDKDGYVLIHTPSHPHRRKHMPYVAEHRLVMEKLMGRYLLPNEVVHHRDGNKQNNDPSNLQLFSENKLHLQDELTGRVPKWSKDGIERMKKGIVRSSILRRGQTLGLSKPDAVQWPKKKPHWKA